MLISWDKCWSLRERSIPRLGLVDVGAPSEASLLMHPSSFSGTCHAFIYLRTFPPGFIFLGSPHSHP